MVERQNEEALSNAGRLLRSYADASLDAIYVKDRNSRWLFANPALQRITGKPIAELLGKTDVEIYSNPEIGRAILANDKKVMESGTPETFEEYVDLPDGRHFFISVKSPRFDENGNVNGLLGISHDITNRKRRELQLKESQQKYLDLVETTADLIWEMDTEGRLTYCSPQIEKLWGFKSAEIIGRNPFDVLPQADRERALDFFMGKIKSPTPFEGWEIASYDGKGRLIFLDSSGVPFFDKEGKLLGFRGITRDITERKKAEEELATSRNALKHERDLLQSVMNAGKNIHLVYLDCDFNFVRVNEEYAKTCGYKPEEMIGKNHFALYPDMENQAIFKRVRDTGVPTQFHDKGFVFPDQPKRGVTYWDWTLEPIKKEDETVEGLVLALVETTERKKAEDELNSRNKELEDLKVQLEDKASEVEKYATSMEELAGQRLVQLKDAERLAAIGATAGMVGHDIRNPLQAISSDIYLALRELSDLPDSEQKRSIKENLESIDQCVDYINKIVQDLQDFARPIIPVLKHVNLDSLCEEVLFKIVPEKIEASSKVEIDVKRIFTDPDLLKRVLTNLVNNAIQAMPGGGKLSLYAFPEARNVVISVSDTGVGIPEMIKPKLFSPLVTTKSKGQGFGLPVVKRTVDALGGSVSFVSEEGKGTTFSISLPRKG